MRGHNSHLKFPAFKGRIKPKTNADWMYGYSILTKAFVLNDHVRNVKSMRHGSNSLSRETETPLSPATSSKSFGRISRWLGLSSVAWMGLLPVRHGPRTPHQ